MEENKTLILQQYVGGGKDYSISLIRLISTIFIVTCHIMQYNNFVLAWWFNVGVQIFLCISGFLYGQKIINDQIDFYKKNIFKLLVDYFVVIILIFIIHIFYIPEVFSIRYVFNIIILWGFPVGGEHFWFVPYIIFCYIITPFLQNLTRKLFDKGGEKSLIIGYTISFIVTIIVFSTFLPYFNSAWINCYLIGYLLGFMKHNNCNNFKFMCLIFSILAVLLNAMKIYVNYIYKIDMTGNSVFNTFSSYAHLFLGVMLFVVMYFLFNKLFAKNKGILNKILDLSDKYSYDVYLVHQFFILGPLSLMGITQYQGINILIICVIIILFAIVVNFLSQLIKKQLKRKKT